MLKLAREMQKRDFRMHKEKAPCLLSKLPSCNSGFSLLRSYFCLLTFCLLHSADLPPFPKTLIIRECISGFFSSC